MAAESNWIELDSYAPEARVYEEDIDQDDPFDQSIISEDTRISESSEGAGLVRKVCLGESGSLDELINKCIMENL